MSRNPPVNRYLADKALDDIDHALGRPVWPTRESHRNYFATDADSDHARAFAASPYWMLSGVQSGMSYYHVTDAGREALAAHLSEVGSKWRPYLVSYEGFERIVPAASASSARYSYFRDLIDVSPDLNFVAFASKARVRLEA